MKIAICNIYNGIVERGAEVFVDKLSNELTRRHEVVVFQSGEKSEGSVKRHIVRGIPYISHQGNYAKGIILGSIFTFLYHFLVFLFTLLTIPKLLIEKYDWIIPVNGGLQVFLVRLIRFITGSKILISAHAGIGRDDRWNIVVGKPDIFIALTHRAYTWAKTLAPHQKVLYIPNGIDTHLFTPVGKRLENALEKPVVLCVSALVSYKRIDLLIRAMQYVPQASLLVVGDGPLREELKKIGEHLLGSRFQLIPPIPHFRMPEVYRAAKIFSLPSSLSEAFGLVYLEAMSCNIPIVTPDDANRRDIIGDAGFYVDPQNSREYARVIEKTIQTSFDTKPRKQAEKFSWEIVSQRYEKAIQNE